MQNARSKSIFLLGLFATMLFVGSAEARRKRSYPSMPHNEKFMSTCTKTLPTVYNPGISNSMQGGKLTRFSGVVQERVNSIEDAAKNGRPVTVAMDYLGGFGAKCNRRERRCLLLVHVPGLDKVMPAYSKRFPNLPKNSFLAIVEDTGGAFYNKGTGKLDIPMRNGFHRGNSLKSASFEVLDQVATSGRRKDYSHFKPFIQGRESKCDIDVPRERDQEKAEPMVSAPKGEIIQAADDGDDDRVAPRKPAARAKKKARRIASAQARPRIVRSEPSVSDIIFGNMLNSAP